MKIFITGITGFVGSHMVDFLLENTDIEIHGLTRWRSPKENIIHCIDKIDLHYGDLLDFSSLYRIINRIRPEYIVHSAAQSYVPYSFKAPVSTLDTNIIGTCNLLEVIKIIKKENKYDPIIQIVSSSEVYGQVKKSDIPIKEDCPLRPASPYAVSKVGEDMLGFQYWKSYELKTIRTRAFTHSVSRWTPVIIKDRDSKLIDIKYISEIRKWNSKKQYASAAKFMGNGTYLWDLDKENIDIWNDGEWTKIKHVSCHSIKESKMLEISCRMGYINVTDNHSIINNKGKIVDAKKLKKGDKIKITKMPYSDITEMTEEIAWLYGFFVAEGDCVYKTTKRIRIANKDISKLEKCKNILLKYFGKNSIIYKEKHDVYRLSVKKALNLAIVFYQNCYASDKNKKIPKIILNADKKTKISFLRGYNEGDGINRKQLLSEFCGFKTKSPILACGLCFLIESILNVKYRIGIERREDKRYFEIRCLSQSNYKNCGPIKPDNIITNINEIEYEGEVWDFETENHWFNAGIGGVIVHNSGPRRGEVFCVSNFAKQIAMIENNKQESIIYVGNLDSVRTFADVRDMVRAYWLLINKCEYGEVYNIGGNITMTVGEMLDLLIKLSTIKNIKVEIDPKRLRPSDVTLQIPCIDKFVKKTGWKPEIPFKKTLIDTLDYWRENNCA